MITVRKGSSKKFVGSQGEGGLFVRRNIASSGDWMGSRKEEKGSEWSKSCRQFMDDPPNLCTLKYRFACA